RSSRRRTSRLSLPEHQVEVWKRPRGRLPDRAEECRDRGEEANGRAVPGRVRGGAKEGPAIPCFLRDVREGSGAARRPALRERRIPPRRSVELLEAHLRHLPSPEGPHVPVGEAGGEPLDAGKTDGVRLDRKRAVGSVEDGDVTARGENAVVLVDVAMAMTVGQMLDDAHDDHEVEEIVGEGQARGLLLREPPHGANLAEPELLDLGPGDVD